MYGCFGERKIYHYDILMVSVCRLREQMACGKRDCLFGIWKDAIEGLRQELEVNNPFFNDTNSRPRYPSTSLNQAAASRFGMFFLGRAILLPCYSLDPDKGMHCSGPVVSRAHAFERHVADILHTLDL